MENLLESELDVTVVEDLEQNLQETNEDSRSGKWQVVFWKLLGVDSVRSYTASIKPPKMIKKQS